MKNWREYQLGRARRPNLKGPALVVFNALCEHPHGITTQELIDVLYEDREDGGPLYATNCVSMYLWFLRQWLAFNYPLLQHRVLPGGPKHVLWIGALDEHSRARAQADKRKRQLLARPHREQMQAVQVVSSEQARRRAG